MFFKPTELDMINNRKNIQHLRRCGISFIDFYRYLTPMGFPKNQLLNSAMNFMSITREHSRDKELRRSFMSIKNSNQTNQNSIRVQQRNLISRQISLLLEFKSKLIVLSGELK